VIALALELSSRHGSAALLSGQEILAEETWDEKDFRGQHVFKILPGMLRKAALSLDVIDVFAVGRGPGSYSGMRVAITAAQGFALPGTKTVYTLSSGEALAQEIAVAGRDEAGQPRPTDAATIAIVGDARRGTVWFGVFEVRDQGLSQVKSWTVLAPDKLAAELPPGTLVVSPDWHKLSPILKGLNIKCLEQDCFPKARIVGQLALRKIELGLPSEPLVPIYTQPAVAAKL
jgi:tRNA threonylcarbamoyladenosine biosynthesis protein TsaB